MTAPIFSPTLWRRPIPLALLFCFAGCGGAATAPAAPNATAGSTPEPPGASLYARYCALCHGAEGEGYASDNATRLRGQGFLRTASDDLLRVAIARGRHGTPMAAYATALGGPLDDEEIATLVAHIRGWQVGDTIELASEPASGDAERGAHLFEAHCQGCHGPLGDGGSAQSLNRWSFLSEADDAFLRYAIVHGREGTPMPGFEEQLSAQEIDDLVAFLRIYEEESHHLPEHLAPPPLSALPLMRHPDGEHPSFTLRDGRYVPAAEVRDAIAAGQRMVILDARPTSDWLIRRLPGSLPVPYYMVTSNDAHDPDMAPLATRLPRDGTWILAYCGCPHAASGAVMDALRDMGFERTAVIDEGVWHWIDQDYPTESGPITIPSSEP